MLLHAVFIISCWATLGVLAIGLPVISRHQHDTDMNGCPLIRGYTFHWHQESFPRDIPGSSSTQLGNGQPGVPALAALCTRDPRCQAFTTKGSFKQEVPSIQAARDAQGCDGIYIKAPAHRRSAAGAGRGRSFQDMVAQTSIMRQAAAASAAATAAAPQGGLSTLAVEMQAQVHEPSTSGATNAHMQANSAWISNAGAGPAPIPRLPDTSQDDLLDQIKHMPSYKVPAYVKQECVRRQIDFCEDAYPSNTGELNLLNRRTVSGSGSFDIFVYSNADIVSDAIAKGGGWEVTDLSLFLWALRYQLPQEEGLRGYAWGRWGPWQPTRLFVDVGANVGWMSLAMAAEGFPVRAFEAMRSNQELIRNSLCRNPDLMRRVVLYPYGLGSSTDTCFIFSDNGNRGDGHTLCGVAGPEEAVKKVPPNYSLRSRMRVMRMDALLAEDIKLLKIDVEGFELFVLEGVAQLIQERRVWFICLEFSVPLLKSTHPPWGHVQLLVALLRLPYRISLEGFQGPWLTTHQAKSKLLREAFHQNLYLTHNDLPIKGSYVDNGRP